MPHSPPRVAVEELHCNADPVGHVRQLAALRERMEVFHKHLTDHLRVGDRKCRLEEKGAFVVNSSISANVVQIELRKRLEDDLMQVAQDGQRPRAVDTL